MNKILIATWLSSIAIGLDAQVTVTLRPGPVDGKDAMIASCVPCGYYNTNYGNTNELSAAAWTNGGSPSDLRSLIEFDLSGIPTSALIIDARLSLYYNPDQTNGQHSGENNGLLQRVTQPWNETTVTWANQPTTTDVHQASMPLSGSATQDFIGIQIRALVQDMIDYPAQGFGFMLRIDNEVPFRRLIFASSDHPDDARHPKLEVTYVMGEVECAYVTSERGKDAFVAGCVPCGYNTSNYGNHPELNAISWTNGGALSNVRALMEFDIINVPTTSVITNVTLSLYHRPNTTNVPQSGQNNAVIRRIADTWNELTVTWDNQPSVIYGQEVYTPKSTSSTQDFPFIDVTELVSEMVKDPSQNFGMMMAVENETPYRSLVFASSDYPDTSRHPRLKVCFIRCNLTHDTASATLCSGSALPFGTQVITGPGTYTETLRALNGCDSTVTLNVSMAQVDASVTQSGATLAAVASNATYQWINCENNSPITGAIGQSFTPTSNGWYAVIVTQDGCTDTSTCYQVTGVGINRVESKLLHITPNPAKDVVFVRMNAPVSSGRLVLYDAIGRTVWSATLPGTEEIALPRNGLPAGHYFVRFTTETTILTGAFQFH